MGNTKLFLKFYHLAAMEARLHRLVFSSFPVSLSLLCYFQTAFFADSSFYVDVMRAQNAVRRHWAVLALRELKRRAQLELSERLALEKRCGVLPLPSTPLLTSVSVLTLVTSPLTL